MTKNTLMVIAISEFKQKGYNSALIETIAEKAGCAKGTVYNYFQNKEQLFLQAIEYIASTHVAFIKERIIKADGPRERLEAFFKAGFDYVNQEPDQAALAISTLFGPRLDFKEALGQGYLPLFGFLAEEVIAKGISAGLFSPCEPGPAASLLMTFYLGCASSVDAEGKVIMDPSLPSGFAIRALEARK